MSNDAPFKDFDFRSMIEDDYTEKLEKFFNEIEPQLKMIENVVKQIKPKLNEYKDVYGFDDFESELLNEIHDRVVNQIT